MQPFLKMTFLFLFATSAFAGYDKYAQYSNFAIPPEFETDQSFLPASYLEAYPVKNTNQKLNIEQKLQLTRLIVAANASCLKKYNQTYLISANSPIFKLILSNFPELKNQNWEGKGSKSGGVYRLEDLSAFLGDQMNLKQNQHKNE